MGISVFVVKNGVSLFILFVLEMSETSLNNSGVLNLGYARIDMWNARAIAWAISVSCIFGHPTASRTGIWFSSRSFYTLM